MKDPIMNQERERMQKFCDGAYLVDVYPGNVGALDGLRADVQTILALRSGGEGWRPTHRHVKRGTEYEVLGTARVQSARPLEDMEAVIVYQDREGVAWVRPPSEFNDGRFEPLPAPSPPTHGEG